MANVNEILRCNCCLYETCQFQLFRSHYIRYHKHDPNFSVSCCLGACGYATNKWGAFRVHMHRKHPEFANRRFIAIAENDDNDYDDNVSIGQHESDEELDGGNIGGRPVNLPDFPDDDTVPLECNQLHNTALFTLSLQGQMNLGELETDIIVNSTADIVDSHVSSFKSKVKQSLNERGIDSTIIDEIPIYNLMDNVRSKSQRYNYYKQHMPYVVPEEVIIGHSFKTKRNGNIGQVFHKAYIVPFKNSIANMLELPEVKYFVEHSHQSSDQFIRDICDADYVRNHPLFLEYPDSLQIILNADDLEVVNPIGSHTKKHKITAFYYSLANIPPQFRSKLSAIQLLAICKTKDIREDGSLDALLKDFIDNLNELRNGIQLQEKIVRGALVIVAADTLAAQWLGGFKEGVGFALKYCRHCECSTEMANSNFVANELYQRDDCVHKNRCSQLMEMSRRAFKYWSKIWGINKSSCLLQVNGFSLTSGLVQDPMHILLEGVVKLELELLLTQFICIDKLFTLVWFNNQIGTFSFSYLHSKERPEKFDMDEPGHIRVKLTAAKILMLCHTLPFIIGRKVKKGNLHWKNFLMLIQIVVLILSPYCSRETSALLRILIAIHHTEYKRLYHMKSVIPKMHYMTHFPEQLLKYGPIRHQWCMRFEGKNGFFKRKKYKSFKNLPYSMAKHHQLYMCLQQSSSSDMRSDQYLYSGDVVGSGEEVLFLELFPALSQEFSDLIGIESLTPSTKVFKTYSVEIHGLRYKANHCVLVHKYDEEDIPQMMYLRGIIVHQLKKYFIVENAKLVTFDTHIGSYIIEPTQEKHVLFFNDLPFKWPISVYNYNKKDAVLVSPTHTCEML